MDWKYNFQDENILEVNCYNVFTTDDLSTMIEEFISDSRWTPDKNIIMDFRELNLENLSLDELYLSLDIHRQFDNKIFGKVAVVHKSYSGYGISSLYEEISRGRINSKFATFISYEDAVKWINEDDAF